MERYNRIIHGVSQINYIIMHNALLIGLGILLITCSPNMEEKWINEAEMAYPERKPLKEWMGAPVDSISSVFVDNNRACVFSWEKKKGENVLVIVDLESGETINSFFPYGPGREEVLLPFITKNQHQLLLYDAVKKHVAILDLTAITTDSLYCPQLYRTNIFSQEIIPFKHRLLFLNPYSFNNQSPRIRISDRAWNYKEKTKYDFDASNVVDGKLQYNQLHKRIVYLADYIPVVELFDEKGRLLKTVHFPHSVCDFESIWHNDLRITEYLYPHRDHPAFPDYAFISVDSNNDYIATVFWKDNWTYLVLVLNWEAEIVDGFFTGTTIKNISISEDSRSIYCWEESGGHNYLREYATRL